MMKKTVGIMILVALVFSMAGCSSASKADVSALQSELSSFKEQNEQLQAENDSLNEQIKALQATIDKQVQAATIQSDNVSVVLSGKSVSSGQYGQNYVDLVFSVTNNTDKAIKGIQGVATFKDLFGVEIMKVNCDFTGMEIEPGKSASVDDLQLECNQFIDSHMKIYSTAFADLKMDYEATQIVFTDGTIKDGK